MALLHQSLFTGSNGVNLNTLTPAIGNTLVNDGGASSLVQNNRAYPSSNYSRYRTNQTLGTANYVARITARRIADTGQSETFALFGRATSLTTDFVAVRFSKTDVQVSKRVSSGSETNIGSAYSWSPSVGVDYVCELVCDGTNISVRIDGVQVIAPITVTDVTAAANVQFDFSQSSGAGFSAAGWHLDTFEVDDTIPGGGGGPSAAARARYRRLCGVQP